MKLMNRFNFILYFFQMFLLFKKNYIRIGTFQNVIVGIKSNRSFNHQIFFNLNNERNFFKNKIKKKYTRFKISKLK